MKERHRRNSRENRISKEDVFTTSRISIQIIFLGKLHIYFVPQQTK